MDRNYFFFVYWSVWVHAVTITLFLFTIYLFLIENWESQFGKKVLSTITSGGINDERNYEANFYKRRGGVSFAKNLHGYNKSRSFVI